MYNGEKIRELLREKNVSNKQLIEFMGWRGNGQLVHVSNPNTANPTAKVLEKIADFFQVPIDTFFVRSIKVTQTQTEYVSYSRTEALVKENENLRELLLEKDKRIELQQKLLDVYAKENKANT